MKPGSNVLPGYLYHDVPGLTNPVHRVGTENRAGAIARGVDLQGKSVCDLGCSAGGISIWLARLGAAEVVGYDYDAEMISLGRRAAASNQVNVRLEHVEITPEFVAALPRFDVIVWLSQWMWFVKQYGCERGYQALFDASRSADALAFETAVADGMAPLPAASGVHTQSDVATLLCRYTAYNDIAPCAVDDRWNERITYICKDPQFAWNSSYSLDGHTVAKEVRRSGYDTVTKVYDRTEHCRNEASILARLQGYRCSPRLISHEETTIQMSYEGPRLKALTDRDRAEIIRMLKNENVQHRDIRPENLRWNGENAVLIDYEWASWNHSNDITPPAYLGDRFKAPHGFDDEWSLAQVQQALLSG